MARFAVSVDINQFPVGVTQGASIAVKLPGKSGNAGTLYADAVSAATLSNPFTVNQPKIVFYMAAEQNVDITVTPSGGTAVAIPNVGVSQSVPQHQTLKMPSGAVVKWFLV